MKKMLPIILALSLMSVSCGKSGGSDAQSTQATSSTIDKTPSVDSTLPEKALSFNTNVTMINFTDEQVEKYQKAIEIVKLVMGTEEFRDQILNYKYNGVKQFANNRGLTNAQIYQSMLDAAETLQPAKNNQMDIEVEFYYSNNTVVGYTNGSTKRIFVNTKFFDQYSANSVAANLTHEWLHKLGYGHDYEATAVRPYSVPYAIGAMMRVIGKNFL